MNYNNFSLGISFLNWVNVILIIGAAQGFLLSALLLHKYRQLYANRFLAAFMFAGTLVMVTLILDEYDFYLKYPHLKFITEGTPFLIGPLLFLYAQYLVTAELSFPKKRFFHFAAFVIYQLWRIPTIFSPASELILFLKSQEVQLSFEYILFNWLVGLHSLLYMLATLRLLYTYKKSLKNMFSSIIQIRLTWLKNIVLLFLVTILFFLFENLLYFKGINLSDFFNYSSALAAISFYLLGYIGLARSEVFREKVTAESIRHLSEIVIPSENVKMGQKYGKSGLDIEKAQYYKSKLIELMENEKIYKNSNLTLNSLAKEMDISNHNLSEVMNTQLNKSFFDFVNYYRVEQVKKDLKNEALNNLTLVAIAFEAGFNSKSSFNMIFKKFTGQTPTQFRESEKMF